jgi:hypothetical protein
MILVYLQKQNKKDYQVLTAMAQRENLSRVSEWHRALTGGVESCKEKHKESNTAKVRLAMRWDFPGAKPSGKKSPS